jgi:DNA polymerase-3 subunit delta
MDSLTFLDRIDRAKPQPVYVLHGDEGFLKRHAEAAIRRLVIGDDAADLALSVYPGDRATFSAVHNDLTTLPFLSARRLVVVQDAEPFVTNERDRLEKYLAAPSAVGVLVLEVKSWPANTRLARALSDAGSISCKAPPSQRLPEWCQVWAQQRHGKELPAAAARLLVDLVGADMGLLDMELAKLAAYVGDAAAIQAKDVDRLVGNSREENTWKLFDLIGEGRPGAALAHLDRLLVQGEDEHRLLGAFSMKMRQLAQAARLSALGASLAEALEGANVPPFARRTAEQQLRHLGRRRLDRLFDWLLETDLGFKGGSSLPPRAQLERLANVSHSHYGLPAQALTSAGRRRSGARAASASRPRMLAPVAVSSRPSGANATSVGAR